MYLDFYQISIIDYHETNFTSIVYQHLTMSYIEKAYRVSVIMGIYNCANTLAESIDSLIKQTYTDWELIMCDDCSSDDTLMIAQSYAERYTNIKIIKNMQNLGLGACLNRCLENCCDSSEFIARQDGDDISEPNRFETEVRFLDNNQKYAFVSTAMICFDERGIWGIQRKPKNPVPNDFANMSPFCHAPVMMRKEILKSIGNYTVNKYLRTGQDYYLWHKYYRNGYVGYNIQEPYYRMRDDRAATLRRNMKNRIYGSKIQLEIMRNLNLPFWKYPKCLRGIIVGLLPKSIYEYFHRKSVNATSASLEKRSEISNIKN